MFTKKTGNRENFIIIFKIYFNIRFVNGELRFRAQFTIDPFGLFYTFVYSFEMVNIQIREK